MAWDGMEWNASNGSESKNGMEEEVKEWNGIDPKNILISVIYPKGKLPTAP